MRLALLRRGLFLVEENHFAIVGARGVDDVAASRSRLPPNPMREQKPDGAKGAVVQAGWNLAQNKKAA